MATFTTLSIISSSVWVVLAGYVLLFRIRSKQSRIFNLLVLACLILSGASVFLYSSRDAETVWFWNHVTAASWDVIIALGMLLVLYFYYDDAYPGHLRVLAIAVPAAIFLYRAITSSTMAREYVAGPYGNYPVHAISNPWFYLYLLYCLQFIVVNYYYLLKKFRSSCKKRVRTQAMVYIFAVTIPMAFATYFEILSPSFGLTKIPAIGHLALLPYLFIVLFAMTRYRMMRIDIPFTSNMIMRNIDSLVMLFNEKGELTSINKRGLDMLELGDADMDTYRFDDIFVEKEKVNTLISEISDWNDPIISEDLALRNGEGSAVPMHVTIGIIVDEFGDRIGCVVTGSKIEVLDSAQKRFGITEREKTILVHLLEGNEYEAIADKLCISVFTVKNHMHNIYQKTGAMNRAELLKVCFVR